MNTRRFSRSMEEAFGPGNRGNLQPMREPVERRWQDLALYAVALLAIIVIVGVSV